MTMIKKPFYAIFSAALMISFFSMQAHVERETESNNGPGLGYYTCKVGLHAAGIVANFFGGQKGKEWSSLYSFAVICHGAGFVLPFFRRNVKLLRGCKRDREFWTGAAMNAFSLGGHIYGANTVSSSGHSWKEANYKMGNRNTTNASRDSLGVLGFGVVIHLIAGFLSEYGAGMMEEPKGMKVAIKMRNGFKNAWEKENTLKNETKKNMKNN